MTWANFEVPDHLKILFFDLTYESRVNPSLIASFLAQESSFNPKAVSWAKALG